MRVVICTFLNFNVPVAIIINLRVSDVSLCKERGKRRYHKIGGGLRCENLLTDRKHGFITCQIAV